MDILDILGIAIDATSQIDSNSKETSLEDVVKKQENALDKLEANEKMRISKDENDRLQITYGMIKIKGNDDMIKLYNKAQELRVYLSYYINKLGGGDTKNLSVGSRTYFRDEPEEALIYLLQKNANDLKILKRAIPILQLGKIKTGGKRKKTRRNQRKNKTKNKTKQKRKAKKQNKTKQRQVRKPRHKRKHSITKKR